mgnify:CR=1 FL=1
MRFFFADGDVEGDIGTQGTQGGDQQAGGGLTIDVEVSPDEDGLAGGDGRFEEGDGLRHTGEVKGRGGLVMLGVEKGADLVRRAQAAAPQLAGDDGMAANHLGKAGWEEKVGKIHPAHFHGLERDLRQRVELDGEIGEAVLIGGFILEVIEGAGG